MGKNLNPKRLGATKKSSGLALIPFLVFIGVYLGSGIILDMQGVEMAFYQFPAPLAAVIGIIVAFIMLKGSLNEKVDTFVRGCGESNIIMMCVIYLMAGGFSAVCKTMGGIDSTVNLGLAFIPARYIALGVFIITSFISLATGSSVGSIVAVGPIAVPAAEMSGSNVALVMACVLCGAMFGDNLSVISDTTIAATRTQGVDMRDKFKINFWITLGPAIITIILLIVFGRPESVVPLEDHSYSIVKVLPYLFVLITAIMGLNVFAVLLGGTVLAGIIGIAAGKMTFLSMMTATYEGFKGMTDIFLLSLLTGGLAEMVKQAGGITFLLEKIKKFIKGKRSAQLGIGALASLTDIAVANNTVAIIIDGEVSKEICNEYKVDPRKSAALLDIFSCVFQGIIPYGAQMLILTGFAKGKVSPLGVLPYSWYIFLLAGFGILSVFVPYADRLIRKDPWDFEKDAPKSMIKERMEYEAQ